MDNYLGCARVRGAGNSASLNSQPVSKVFTVSDETMVLWFMENNWDVWATQKANNNMNDHSVSPKYTISGDKGGNTRVGGWNKEGRQRFNELYDKVEEDRTSDYGVFDSHYLDHRKSKKNTSKTGHSTKPIAVASLDTSIPMRNSLSHARQAMTASSSIGQAPLLQQQHPLPPSALYSLQSLGGAAASGSISHLSSSVNYEDDVKLTPI